MIDGLPTPAVTGEPKAGHFASLTARQSGEIVRVDARHWHQLVSIAEKETAAIIRGLPAALREPASRVPVVFQPWVDEALAGPDVEADVLGLFVGAPHDVTDAPDPLPPQIFLFLESIWTAVDADAAAFREEVGVTFMHELGHYLGLDEDELEYRGLD